MSNASEEHLSEIEAWEYIDDPSAFVHYEKHLSACPACARLVSDAKSIEVDIRNLKTPEPSAQFTSSVVAKVMASAGSYPWFIRTVVTSFIFVFGLTIYLLLEEGLPPQFDYSFFYSFAMVIVIASFLILESVKRLKSLNVG